MSELNREKKTEIKKQASEYYGQIKAEKKRLSTALSKYEKIAASLADSASKYERAAKKYNKKPTEKNRLSYSSAKSEVVSCISSQSNAAKQINASIEYVNEKYVAIADMLAAVKKNGSRAPERKRAAFLRGIAVQVEDAIRLLSRVDISEFDIELGEVASPASDVRVEESSMEKRSAHTIYGAVTHARLDLKLCLKNCKKLARRLVRCGKKYLKIKAKRISGRRISDARLSAKKEKYLKALSSYNASAAEMNYALDFACDHYEELKEVLSADRKRASARIAAEYERCVKSTAKKVSRINSSMKKLGVPSAK